jgi:hypothetical protein
MVTTLHSRLDLPALQPLHREFADVPAGVHQQGPAAADPACKLGGHPSRERGLYTAIRVARRAGFRSRRLRGYHCHLKTTPTRGLTRLLL